MQVQNIMTNNNDTVWNNWFQDCYSRLSSHLDILNINFRIIGKLNSKEANFQSMTSIKKEGK